MQDGYRHWFDLLGGRVLFLVGSDQESQAIINGVGLAISRIQVSQKGVRHRNGT